MINLLRKLATGFLSTIAFFAAFMIAGDVLIAALVAIAGAGAQFVLVRAARHTPDMTTRTASWASLAVVLVVTGTTLVGVEIPDASASASHRAFTPVSNICPVSQRAI
jgi:intracellular septation protein A